MALIIPVLVRGINNLSDARYCAGMGADGLIFTLDSSLPGAVDVATVKELAGWVAGVKLLGEFDTLPVSEINRLVEECSLQEVVIGQTPAVPFSVPALLRAPAFLAALDGAQEEMLQQYTPVLPAGFGLVVTVDLPLSMVMQYELAQAATRFPLWICGPITADNVRDLIDTIHPAGLLLEGGDEIKPGLRDFTELEAVFEALEEE